METVNSVFSGQNLRLRSFELSLARFDVNTTISVIIGATLSDGENHKKNRQYGDLSSRIG